MKKYILTISTFFILISCADAKSSNRENVNISANEAFSLVIKNKSNNSFIIIDIRTPEEYKSGHIDNAILIDYYSSDFSKNIKNLDKNASYLIYCRSGNRSGRAISLFEKLDFKQVKNLQGGIIEWKRNGYPLKYQ